jgi:hypothetical protein
MTCSQPPSQQIRQIYRRSSYWSINRNGRVTLTEDHLAYKVRRNRRRSKTSNRIAGSGIMSPRRPLVTHRSYWLVNQMTLGFCIDYRSLNDCTQSASWPIPNIKEMFARLRTHHSDTFGVMDLTAGYHQAPVSLGTRYFSFYLFCGIFQFCRLPFGPKRAPSYFQQMMSSVVLIGLLTLYVRCTLMTVLCTW